MKLLFWLGLVVLVLGLASFVIAIPSTERQGIKAGGLSVGVETQSSEKVSPVISGVMLLVGAGLMIAGKR
jgi:hypothetical protein